LELFCDVLHHEITHFDWHISIGDLGCETQPTLNSGKYFWKRALFFSFKLKLRRFSSGKNILDSGNIYTAHNQQFHWDVLQRWCLNLSRSLSLFIPIFCVLPVSLRDCLYSEKDVDGGWWHGHISHLVHPKTRFLDRLQHTKKGPTNLANTFSDAKASPKKKLPADASKSFSYVTNPTCGVCCFVLLTRWQVPLDKLVNLTSRLDKLTCHLALFNFRPRLLSLFRLIWSYNLSSCLVKSTCTILTARKCRTLESGRKTVIRSGGEDIGFEKLFYFNFYFDPNIRTPIVQVKRVARSGQKWSVGKTVTKLIDDKESVYYTASVKR